MKLRGWQLVSALATAAFGIALLAGIGHIGGASLLVSWGAGRPPMQPVMILLVIILALLLVATEKYLSLLVNVEVLEDVSESEPTLRLKVTKVGLALIPKHVIRAVSLVGLLAVGLMLVVALDRRMTLVANDNDSGIPLPQSLFCVILLFAASAAATYQRISSLLLIQIANLVVMITALSALVGHLLDTASPLLMGLGIISSSSAGMPLPTSIAILCLGAGFMVNAGRDVFLAVPVRQFSSFGSVALLLVSIAGMPVLLGWMAASLAWDDRYGRGSSLALLVIANIFLQLPVILHVARRLFFKEFQLKETAASLKEALAAKESLAGRLRELSRRDALTDLYNRRAFEEDLKRYWRRGVRTGRPLSLLYMDIDHFKGFNDHYGHPAGDACLSAFAAILKEVIGREGDMAARLGGEEFVLLLPETTLEGALCVARRLQDRLAGLAIPHAASPVAGTLTVSVGLATQVPVRSASCEVLIERADKALYEAKRSGRNCTFVDLQSAQSCECATIAQTSSL
ncbi:MAG TPA: GGDEF domain-containing protein [Fluviicoccus sp.]|nr:GGDEF domain-containing protein [Fluviicoccus sp.]